MNYEMRLHPEPFQQIRSGKQQIEVRIYDQKRQQLKIGDNITFYKRPECKEQILTKVIGLSIFDSFRSLFNAIEKTKFGYSNTVTIDNQLDCMRKFYSTDEEEKYGVVGIHLQIL
jgi:ASC-1-like (ASCH) protein